MARPGLLVYMMWEEFGKKRNYRTPGIQDMVADFWSHPLIRSWQPLYMAFQQKEAGSISGYIKAFTDQKRIILRTGLIIFAVRFTGPVPACRQAGKFSKLLILCFLFMQLKVKKTEEFMWECALMLKYDWKSIMQAKQNQRKVSGRGNWFILKRRQTGLRREKEKYIWSQELEKNSWDHWSRSSMDRIEVS